MTHVGGSREYTVPPVRRGLFLGSLANFTNNVHEDGDEASLRSSEEGSEGYRRGSAGLSNKGNSTTSLPLAFLRPRNQVTQHLDHLKHSKDTNGGRIPSKNFKEKHKNSALASFKTSGIPVSLMNTFAVGSRGERTARLNGLHYHFSGATDWERDPEDVVEALFKNMQAPARMARPSGLVGTDERHSYASSIALGSESLSSQHIAEKSTTSAQTASKQAVRGTQDLLDPVSVRTWCKGTTLLAGSKKPKPAAATVPSTPTRPRSTSSS